MPHLVTFCRDLRELGLDLGPGDTADAARALLAVDVGDPDQVFLALRSVLCRKVEDYPTFSGAFLQAWQGQKPVNVPGEAGDGQAPKVKSGQPGRPERSPELRPGGAQEGQAEAEPAPGYTAEVLLARKDLGRVNPEDWPELARLAQLMARRLAMRLARRLRRNRRGPIDPSRTFRRALRQGGEVLQLRRRRRRRDRARLVSLLDVSGSMQPYGKFLLLFLSALAQRLPRAETFVFSTHLTRVTREVRERNLDQAVGAVPDWAGGTRIGASLRRFAEEWAPALVDRRTALLILSDGLDTGELDVLSGAMGHLSAHAGRIVWLNPLAGDPQYEPLARGMRTALPFVDVLAPAHSLESLLALGKHIVGA